MPERSATDPALESLSVLASAGTSERRKAAPGGSDDETAASESDVPRAQTAQEQAQVIDLKRRTKIACFFCLQSAFILNDIFRNVFATIAVAVK